MSTSVAARRGALATTAWPGAVLLPFVVSRALVLWTAERAASARGIDGVAVLGAWDGAWYAQIARLGYGFAHASGETPYPFFPLWPALLRCAAALGWSPVAFGVLLNHAVFLLALWGVWAIARDHGTPQEATAAVWSLALFPGSAVLTMLYPCAIFLACGVWAFRAAEQRRDALAGALAAVAALVRPNGAVIAAVLAGAALLDRFALRRAVVLALPAAACVAAWLAWLGAQTGDPLIFVHAKSAWREMTLASVLSGVDPPPKIDLAAGAFALAVLVLAWRRLPAAWLVLAALCLLPSLLVLGLLGLPRYAAACFPVFVATGVVLARLPAALRVAALVAFAAGLLFVAQRIFLLGHMP